MEPLSISAQTLYAELLEQLLGLDARRSIGAVPGAFVEKRLPSGTYLYFQHSAPGGVLRQTYVGKKSAALDAVVARFTEERSSFEEDRAATQALCAALRGAGAGATDPSTARVIDALASAGVFKLGGVLVGTNAFLALGNVLGVRWTGAAARTEDVDVAATRHLEVAVPELEADVPRALDALGMGFLPVPGFSPDAPSTSFKVRGKGLRVDLVTPARPTHRGPVPIPRLRAAAAPVQFLEMLLEATLPAALIAGAGVLVSVPDPARFALHKVLVAQDRPATFQAKVKKDLVQAAAIVDALEALRPGDLAAAVERVRAEGRRTRAALARGIALLAKVDAGAAERLAG